MQTFNYHNHTARCGHADKDYSEEDYIKEYIRNGFKKMAFTDHMPEKDVVDFRRNVRMSYFERTEYLETIQKLKEKYAGTIEINSGYEIEYLPGYEENLFELKNETDMIILGQHFIYDRMHAVKPTAPDTRFGPGEILKIGEYTEKAISLGLADIIAHPDFFMLSRDSFGSEDAELAHMVCSCAEKYDIPVEINLNHIFYKTIRINGKYPDLTFEQRVELLKNAKYPCPGFWEIAAKYNLRVLFGLDVHSKGQIDAAPTLIELAKIKLGKEIIQKLNFLTDGI